MEILKFPHPALFTVCKPITEFGPELKKNLDAMWDVMDLAEGMGLSANQVGICERYFVMRGSFGERIYLVNPVIYSKSNEISPLIEGCLSAPGDFLSLNRSEIVWVKYQNEKGKSFDRSFTNYFSVCVQHEVDHLDGKSFLESEAIDKKIRKKLAKKWGLV